MRQNLLGGFLGGVFGVLFAAWFGELWLLLGALVGCLLGWHAQLILTKLGRSALATFKAWIHSIKVNRGRFILNWIFCWGGFCALTALVQHLEIPQSMGFVSSDLKILAVALCTVFALVFVAGFLGALVSWIFLNPSDVGKLEKHLAALGNSTNLVELGNASFQVLKFALYAPIAFFTLGLPVVLIWVPTYVFRVIEVLIVYALQWLLKKEVRLCLAVVIVITTATVLGCAQFFSDLRWLWCCALANGFVCAFVSVTLRRVFLSEKQEFEDPAELSILMWLADPAVAAFLWTHRSINRTFGYEQRE